MQPTQIRLVDCPDATPGDETWEIMHDLTPELLDGAVRSVAAQVAKLQGSRVIGIAGGRRSVPISPVPG